MSGWDVELLFARNVRNRRVITRDRDRGIVLPVHHGIYVDAASVADLSPEDMHIIRIRAVQASSDRPLVFSHWSAGVLAGLDVLQQRLAKVHVTFEDVGARGLQGVAGHVFAIREEEVIEMNGLLVTDLGRTVVDLSCSGTFADGVVAADSALRQGVPREALEAAVDRVGPRRAIKRAERVVAFADGLSGSAGESLSRVGMDRMGLHPLLQRRHYDHRGYIGRSDFYFPDCEAVGEFDGRVKFTDPRFAPTGAADVLWAEKVREDRMRGVNKGFGRWGWPEANDPRKLAPVLRSIGVRVPSRF
jgi:hypothetical protein